LLKTPPMTSTTVINPVIASAISSSR